MKRLKSGKRKSTLVLEALLLTLTLVIIVPYIMVVLGSFKNLAEASVMTLSLPSEWLIVENYMDAFTRGRIMSGFLNSAFNTVIVVVITLLITSLAAFIIQRKANFKVKLIFGIIMTGIIMPTNIVTLVFLVGRGLKLNNSLGLILTQISAHVSFCTVLFVSYVKGVPRELDESAFLEGCGPVRTFYSIIFPLLKPMTATLTVFITMGVWNDFKTPLYLLNDPKLYTISLSLFYFIGESGNTRWNLIFAGMVLVSLPIIIVYLFMQEQIISGLTEGAVKG